MAPKPPPFVSYLFLGAGFVAAGGLLWLSFSDGHEGPSSATVAVRVLEPDGDSLFNGTLRTPEGENHPLGALLEAARLGGFDVVVDEATFGRAFVVAVNGIHNQGNCGWVWDRNAVRGDRAADERALEDGDAVLWHWDCEG